MIQNIAILGDGQMGLVLADALAERGVGVRLWGPRPEMVAKLAESRTSPTRLPDFVLHDAIQVTADDAAILADVELIINAIPTQFIRSVWQRLASAVPPEVPIVSVSKGIEVSTLLLPDQIILDALSEDWKNPTRFVCALSGPTIAAELARRLPATMIAAANNAQLAKDVQELFDVPWLRVYRHDDLLGVELAGAAKNVIAIAAGMIDGLEIGANAKSALLARGLAEIARLGNAMGAKVDTFFGVAGVGDLATSCFSPHGRNRTCGERIGRGETLQHILDSTVSVVEGVPTTKSIVELARRHQVDMPITHAVNGILFEDINPREAIGHLMGRTLKAERIG